jgi:short-subunit dehydrogenase
MTKINRSELAATVRGKNIIITGASSGIGLNVAHLLAKAGAHVILVARTQETLEAVKAEIVSAGGSAAVYPCDLNDMDAIDTCAKAILTKEGAIDVLINNAGRSIRRAVTESTERFHDFERTMQLNYFGAVRFILAVLPTMVKRKRGHVVNVSSIGVLTNTPRFSAYVASKAALDAFSRCLASEVKSKNIDISTIYMPLVRTPMIAPTKMYDNLPTLTPDEAADLIAEALIKKSKSIATMGGTLGAVTYAIVPKLNDSLMSLAYHMFPSSDAALGKKGESDLSVQPTLLQRAFTMLRPGEHW